MLKLNIDSQRHGLVWKEFEDQEFLDQYLNEISNSQHWGRNERWVQEGQEDISNALETREVEISPEVMVTEYKLPAEYSIEIIDLGNEPLLELLRAQRDSKLAECDWTQLADCPLSSQAKADWAAYRQALRDLPQQEGLDPANPVWPSKP